MAVAFDAQGHFNAASAGTSFTDSSFTVGSGANRVLIVTINWGQAAIPSGVSVVWDNGGTNQAMTAITGASINNVSAFAASMQMYGLVAPTSGNKQLSISWSTTSLRPIVGYISATGALQTGGTATFAHGTSNTNTTGSSAGPFTLTVTSASGDMVAAQHTCDGATAFSSTSATQDWLSQISGVLSGAANHTAGAASVSMQATLSAADTWGAVGCDIVAAPAGGLPPGSQVFDTPRPDRATSLYPPQLRNWRQPDRFLLIGQDQFPPGAQNNDEAKNDLPPAWYDRNLSNPIWRSWQDRYKLTLIGQDTFPPGKQAFEPPSAWQVPDPFARWRSWTWSYDLNLIGLDKFPPGRQWWLTPAIPDDRYFPQQLRSWAWQYNPLIQFITAPPGVQTNYLPASQISDVWAQWRSWIGSFNLNLIGQDVLPSGKQINYLPASQIYDPFAQWRSWTGWYNLNLIGRDILPPGIQTNYLPIGVSWRPESPQQNLSNTLLLPQLIPPGQQFYDRFIDRSDPFASWRSFTQPYQPNLYLGQDQFPVGAIWDDLPPRDFQRGVDFFTSVNIALLNPPILPPGQRIYDRFIDPVDMFSQWRRWTHGINLNLIGLDQFPPGQTTNYMPLGVTWNPQSPQPNILVLGYPLPPPVIGVHYVTTSRAKFITPIGVS